MEDQSLSLKIKESTLREMFHELFNSLAGVMVYSEFSLGQSTGELNRDLKEIYRGSQQLQQTLLKYKEAYLGKA